MISQNYTRRINSKNVHFELNFGIHRFSSNLKHLRFRHARNYLCNVPIHVWCLHNLWLTQKSDTFAKPFSLTSAERFGESNTFWVNQSNIVQTLFEKRMYFSTCNCTVNLCSCNKVTSNKCFLSKWRNYRYLGIYSEWINSIRDWDQWGEAVQLRP